MATHSFTPKLKCLIIGNHRVGKTYMLYRYTRDDNNWLREVKINCHDPFITYTIVDNKEYLLDIHDTYGHEDYDRIWPTTVKCQNTDVILFCFDLSNKCDSESLAAISNRWIPMLQQYFTDEMPPFMVIGCKDDLRKSKTKLWSYQKRMNLLITGYLRPENKETEPESEWIAPSDILGVIEDLLWEDWDDNHVSDEVAQKLCDDIGGYKYMTCSAYQGLNFDENIVDWHRHDHPMDSGDSDIDKIFEEVCLCWCWRQNQNKKSRKKSCSIL
eukprot:255189_1